MPCRYDESPEELAQSAAKAKARRDRELNHVTNLLCQVCKELERPDHETFEDIAHAISGIDGLVKWWEEHQKRDNKKAKS